MDDNHIIYIFDVFNQYEHCFTFEDLSNFAEPDFDSELLKHALLNVSLRSQRLLHVKGV